MTVPGGSGHSWRAIIVEERVERVGPPASMNTAQIGNGVPKLGFQDFGKLLPITPMHLLD